MTAKPRKKPRFGKPSNMGMAKHRQVGKRVTGEHFTGMRSKKSHKKKRKSSRRQRRMRMHTHKNKYGNG